MSHITLSTATKVEQAFNFDANTPEEVQKILTSAYHSQRRIRIWLGDRETGISWGEEHDVCGSVGRSTGTKKVPLLITRKDCSGGPAILTANIVRIDYTDTKKTAYRHPTLDIGTFTTAPVTDAEAIKNGYTTAVYMSTRKEKSVCLANFKKPEQAQRFIDFMTGARYNK